LCFTEGGDWIMEYLIYLVEDDRLLNSLLTSYLKMEGWLVHSFTRGEEAKNEKNLPHLWIIDIMLPGISGYELVGSIKAESPTIPIILISSKNSNLEKIVGLEIGADDYLPKPFMAEELVVRVRKLLARSYRSLLKEDAEQSLPEIFMLKPYIINRINRAVTKNGKPVELTVKEFSLLLLFIINSNLVLSREQILHQVWDTNYMGTNHLVDDLVYRLRKRMPHLEVETNYSYGYRLVVNDPLEIVS